MSRTEEVNKMTENVYKVKLSFLVCKFGAQCVNTLCICTFNVLNRLFFFQQGILDQFNPSLKNFVTMGKHYEKALTGDFVLPKCFFPVNIFHF